MKTWKLKLDDYGIDAQRYAELLAICRQYDKYKRADAQLRRGECDRRSCGNTAWHRRDPTGNQAARLADSRCGARAKAIEAAAESVGGALGPYILRNVARGIPYERLGVPCGRRKFFEVRRAFFVDLDARV